MIGGDKQKLKVLITVKTYPNPSATYDELVCTAGVTETGDFVRLYPINFRDLAYSQQYKKYQWIEVTAEQHRRDKRKESYRPDSDTMRPIGKPIKSAPDNWRARARYALAKKARSMEDLYGQWEADRTSLGVFKPKKVHDLVVTPVKPDDIDWKPSAKEKLRQARLWDTRTVSLKPPRKVPFTFHYRFTCDDDRCKGHKMMITDWEVGALFWRLVDKGHSQEDASRKVREKFLDELCGDDKDTHFFVGTVHNYQKSWIVLGVFYPKAEPPGLFDRQETDKDNPRPQ